MPRHRAFGAAAVFDGRFALIGGIKPSLPDANFIDVFNPADQTWSTADSYPGLNTRNIVTCADEQAVYILTGLWEDEGSTHCWKGTQGLQ